MMEERLYEGLDPSIVDWLESLTPEQAKSQLSKILGKFPNTYTYTKNLAEKNILRRKGDLTTVFVRPSIIGSCWEEPVPAWVDSI